MNSLKQNKGKNNSKFPNFFPSHIYLNVKIVTLRHHCRLLFHTNCHLQQIYFIWTIPALTSFWILFITIGFFVCSCAALGFSWKSINTCIDSTHPTYKHISLLFHYHNTYQHSIKKEANLSHNRVLKDVLNFGILHCLGLKEYKI